MRENVRRISSLHRALVFGAIALFAGIQSPAASWAWTLKTLYSFCAQANCADGKGPHAGLILDKFGNLYGTTAGGGANSAGAVFKLDSSGNETVLYSFCSVTNCRDGQRPMTALVRGADGTLYGTTYGHGSPYRNPKSRGTIFAISPGGAETTLCTLGSANCPTGEFPLGSLAIDAAGNLYGTAAWGGTNFITGFYCCGLAFKLAATGDEIVLHGFCSLADCQDGATPEAGLVADPSGNLYGTTFYGGLNSAGTVFELAAGAEKVIYNFCSAADPDCSDGAYPLARLVMDGSGNLYGTTLYGGTSDRGAVFEIAAGGSETVLHSFCSAKGCPDGAFPRSDLVIDSTGNLYGTTQGGGAGHEGVVFQVTSAGEASVLYSFCSIPKCRDGKVPLAGFVMDKAGNLYGTTSGGGANGKGGTVFELTRQ